MKSSVQQKSFGQDSQLPTNQIDWNSFNYPRCLKLFNYQPSKIPQQHRKQIKLLWFTHVLIWTYTLLNLLTNIIATSQGFDSLRIGISIFLILFLWPYSLYMFYHPYILILKHEGKPWVFYLMAGLALVFFAIWTVADFADANGFVRVDTYFRGGWGASGAFGLLTSVMSLVVTALLVVNIFKFCGRE